MLRRRQLAGIAAVATRGVVGAASPSSSTGAASPTASESDARGQPLLAPRREKGQPPRAPPLMVMSWSVDGPMHTHHRCRRRLTLAQRIPGIVLTIRAAAPDVVALQDATPEIAAALTSTSADGGRGSSEEVPLAPQTRQPRADDSVKKQQLMRSMAAQLSTLHQWYRTALHRFTNAVAEGAAEDAAAEADVVREEDEGVGGGGVLPTYRCLGVARNGRCGEVQLFVRSDSPWRGRLLPTHPGVTAELVYGAAPAGSSSPPASDSKARPLRFTVTNVDLSYRGKSLSVGGGGGMLASPEVSRDGSPFSLTRGQGEDPTPAGRAPPSGRHRPKGALDAHREVALDFLTRVTRPNLLVGNFFMGRAESLSTEGKHAYADAWAMAGRLSHQERTINTVAQHARDKRTNYFYFVPTAGVAAAQDRPGQGSAAPEGENEAEEGGGPSATVAKADVGAELSLSSCLTRQGSWTGGKTAPRQCTLGTSALPSSPPEHTAATLEDAWLAQQLALAEAGTAAARGTRGYSVGVPEVAGRAQRCFVRRYSGQPGQRPAAQVPEIAVAADDVPFSQVFRRCRVMVLKGFVETTLGPQEAAWHRAHGKLTTQPPVAAASMDASPADAEGAVPHEVERREDGDTAVANTVPCSVSDQYPLIVCFS